MDDKDFWEEEYTDLDKYQKRKNLSKAMVRLKDVPTSFGLSGQSIVNDAVAKALEENPSGWMMTDLKRNATHFNGMDGIITMPSVESELIIKIWDEELISKLIEVMRHMSS